MDNVSFEAKKCVRNTVPSNLENQISKTFPSVTSMGAPYKILIWQTVKKLKLWEKIAVNKSTWIKIWMYGSWDMECETEFFVIKTPFSLLTPLITQKIKILKKWKKAWRQYHFTHVYHKWKSYMMCGSWDMERDRKNFLSFCTILYPFT